MNILVIGYGAIGKKLVETINHTPNLTLAGIVALNDGPNVSKSCAEISHPVDVIIDFSHPNNLTEVLDFAKKNHASLVIATTGHSQAEKDAISKAASDCPIVFCSNTSYGVNVLLEALKVVAPMLSEDFDIEVIEKHHNKKLDAPSGTAKTIVDTIEESITKDTTRVYGRSGMAKREKNEIGIHAIRGGTIPGEHTIIFSGDDEIIELKHEALSKNIFVNGALKAAKFIASQENGLYTMADVLKN